MKNEYLITKFLNLTNQRIEELEAAQKQASKSLLTNEDYDTFADYFERVSSISTRLTEDITRISIQRRKWESFLKTLSITKTPYDRLKPAQLAQAILESGWGSSGLFLEYNNPYGMKYRKEMEPFARSVQYKGESYCSFPTIESSVLGYWDFIKRSPYVGFEKADNILKYITFITYAGYFGGKFDGSEIDRARKNEYIKKVMSLVDDAQKILGGC